VLFSSITFLFYFLPATLLLYCLCGFSRTVQNVFLFAVSLLFYAWGEPAFVLLMLLSIVVNYGLARLTAKHRTVKRRAYQIIALAAAFNIGILFFFKYLTFVVGNINALAGMTLISVSAPPLPIGISFFTFRALSYIVDVYKERVAASRNILHIGLYIAFFPTLLAGPIDRYGDIAAQITKRKMSWEGFSIGCARFIIGLGKKVLIANALGAVADRIFAMSAAGNHVMLVPSLLAWLGVVAYTLQIYFDFSSYSDMAIGLARMFGFTLKENFNYPYIATSATEFWRRWHISLSSWFRDYVYIPLGGSRPTEDDLAPGAPSRKNFLILRNLFVVWLLTGIWHGANWTFIFWGLWYFVFILFERVTRWNHRRIPKPLGHIYLLLVVSLGWVFFRAANMHDAITYVGNLLALNDNGLYSPLVGVFLRENLVYFVAGIVFSTPFARNLGEMLQDGVITGGWRTAFCAVYPALLLGVYCLSVVYLTQGNYKPFIYFNF
jgi:alginate O-acetyltransferase complex protein AlgI